MLRYLLPITDKINEMKLDENVYFPLHSYIDCRYLIVLFFVFEVYILFDYFSLTRVIFY